MAATLMVRRRDRWINLGIDDKVDAAFDDLDEHDLIIQEIQAGQRRIVQIGITTMVSVILLLVAAIANLLYMVAVR